jgi:membrane fusion protein, heavy metal efflux system
VQQRVFRSEHVTEGKIAVDEDRSTPIFSPYAGRVLKLFVKPGDTVTVGQPLFTVQATEHGAGAERFYQCRDRPKQSPFGAQPGADHR